MLDHPVPIISLCMPTYNRAGMVREAIDSILAQTFADFELIVSDNASTDGTEDVIRSYKDPRIVYSCNPTNIGCHHNINKCLSLAKGEFIGIFMDDDIMMPDNLSQKMALFRKHPSVGLVHSKYHVIDGAGALVRSNTNWGHGPDRDTDVVEDGQEVLKQMLLSRNIINMPTVVFRRCCYEQLGGFDDAFAHADDWEYWMRIAVHYDIGFIASPLVKWRVHSGSLTSTEVQSRNTFLSHEGLREELLAKRMILMRYGHKIREGRDLMRRVQAEASVRVLEHLNIHMGGGGPNKPVRNFILKVWRDFPELFGSFEVWKLFVKSVLPVGRISDGGKRSFL